MKRISRTIIPTNKRRVAKIISLAIEAIEFDQGSFYGSEEEVAEVNEQCEKEIAELKELRKQLRSL